MKDRSLVEAAHGVLERLAAWRSTRRGGDAIPEEIWSAAVEVACGHGVYQTSRHLRLHYGDLKRRVRQVQVGGPGAASDCIATSRVRPAAGLTVAPRSAAAAAGATFVEWLPAVQPSVIGSCVLQVESRRGASMRIEMHQVPPDAVAAIIRSFGE